ncbi:MAG: hypothetical protein ACI8RD_014621, partial [Bacillariaceae sp.]
RLYLSLRMGTEKYQPRAYISSLYIDEAIDTQFIA